MIRWALFFSIMSVLPLGCKTTPIASRPLSISDVEKLKIGKDDRAGLLARFGKPEIIVPPGKLKVGSPEFWVYVDLPNQSTRLSLGIDSTTNKLTSVLWVVLEKDPEIDLPTTLKRFESAHFVDVEVPWINSHAQPEEELLVDKAKGLTITYRRRFETKKIEVMSINWSQGQNLLTANESSK